MTPDPGFEVQINSGSFKAPAGLLDAAVRRTLKDGGLSSAEISVTLLDDAGMRRLNLEYLGKDAATDVLSFSLGDTGRPVGDVYVGLPQAVRQADELGVDVQEELVRLVVHGTLHALGHDHPEGADRDASPMFAVQERLVRDILAGETG